MEMASAISDLNDDYYGSGYPFFKSARSRDVFKAMGLTAIYIMGTTSNDRVKIGFSKNPFYRLKQVQVSSVKNVIIKYMIWTEQSLLIRRLESEVHSLLIKGGRHLRGEWFDVPVPFIFSAIDLSASKLRMTMLTHDAALNRAIDARENIIRMEMAVVEEMARRFT